MRGFIAEGWESICHRDEKAFIGTDSAMLSGRVLDTCINPMSQIQRITIGQVGPQTERPGPTFLPDYFARYVMPQGQIRLQDHRVAASHQHMIQDPQSVDQNLSQ
jgi:hypothetical protein